MLTLACKNIEIKFGYDIIIEGVELNVHSNEAWAITGFNGCGKTSLLRILAGLSKPEKGHVSRLGEFIWPENKETKEHFCLFLSSQPALLLNQSVIENLHYYCRCFGLGLAEKNMEAALKDVGLFEKKHLLAQKLSTGQKRRLTLAATILIQPKIILADEPTNGLDAAGVQLCQEIFNSLKSKNKSSLLIATHDKELIEWCSHQINLEKFLPKTNVTKKKIEVLL